MTSLPFRLRALAQADAGNAGVLEEAAAWIESQTGVLEAIKEVFGGQVVIFDAWEMTCGGAPVQFSGRDRITGRELYFRERHGYFRVDMDMGEQGDADYDWTTIASGEAPEFQTDMDGLNELLAPFGIQFGDEKAEQVAP